jgi:hypothetical protein
MKYSHNLFPVSFFALQGVRQTSVVLVVKIFACVGTTYRDWLERQEKIFPLRRKPTFVFGFSLLKNTLFHYTQPRSARATNENYNSGFLFTSPSLLLFRSYALYFFYSNDDASSLYQSRFCV